MILLVPPRYGGNSRVDSQVQRLNPIDGAMRCADVAVRQMGYPGIETQMLAWLAARADPALLQTATARLSRRYPIIASRLIEPGDDQGGRPHWQFRPGQVCALQEATLDSDDPETVLDHAGEILSNGRDPAGADPLEFHLLHRPGGKDVLLLQYNHVLMDNRAAVPLLRELDSLSRIDAPAEPITRQSPIWAHLRQFPRAERHKAVRAAIQLQAHALRGRAATVLPQRPAPPGRARLGIVARTLGPAATAGLRARVIALCGFPCVSMAGLASAFRAIDHCGPSADDRRDFVAAIGIPIRRSDPQTLAFQNLTSAVPMRVPRPDLLDRNLLVRALSDQLRQRLMADVDLGVLETTAIFSRRSRYIEWVAWHLLRYGYSLWYAYFGVLDAVGGTLCGVTIEDLFHTGGPIWSSIGLTLLVNQYRDRLHFQATYDSRLASRSLVDALLDFVLTDLCAYY
jgi:hypothetical protein